MIPQVLLNHWFHSRIDKLEARAICLKEFDNTPMEDYFYDDHNAAEVTWDITKKEGISHLYKMKAQYGWAVAKRDYVTKYINTGYGQTIKEGMDHYLENYPNVKVDQKSIENKVEEILNEAGLGQFNIGMDYSIYLAGTKGDEYINISTYYTSNPDEKIVDYIVYSF